MSDDFQLTLAKEEAELCRQALRSMADALHERAEKSAAIGPAYGESSLRMLDLETRLRNLEARFIKEKDQR